MFLAKNALPKDPELNYSFNEILYFILGSKRMHR